MLAGAIAHPAFDLLLSQHNSIMRACSREDAYTLMLVCGTRLLSQVAVFSVHCSPVLLNSGKEPSRWLNDTFRDSRLAKAAADVHSGMHSRCYVSGWCRVIERYAMQSEKRLCKPHIVHLASHSKYRFCTCLARVHPASSCQYRSLVSCRYVCEQTQSSAVQSRSKTTSWSGHLFIL